MHYYRDMSNSITRNIASTLEAAGYSVHVGASAVTFGTDGRTLGTIRPLHALSAMRVKVWDLGSEAKVLRLVEPLLSADGTYTADGKPGRLNEWGFVVPLEEKAAGGEVGEDDLWEPAGSLHEVFED